jgi:hypothetical protein
MMATLCKVWPCLSSGFTQPEDSMFYRSVEMEFLRDLASSE